jgi:CheY-like chemotaxis protein
MITLGEHIKVDFTPEPALKMVQADPVQIEQIIVNLCVNARDAMSNGGVIKIETKNIVINKEFCDNHSFKTSPGEYAMICISDTGHGMDKHTLENIFDPFFTTKDVGAGTGLGLSTVYGLVKQHSGIIDVSSTINEGTSFKVFLPQSKSYKEAPPEFTDKTDIGGRETILLAEDDKGVFTIAKLILESAGYNVLGASDGVEAIEVYNKKHKQINMALLDVMMPRKGGREVYEHIRSINPDFKVLFASGYSMKSIHTNFVLDDGMNLIQKPYQRHELLKALRCVMDS